MSLYLKKNCCLFVIGLLTNLIGLAGNLATPWFIGQVVEGIQNKQWDKVNLYSLIWFGFSATGAIFQGIGSFIFGKIQNTIGM